MNLTEAIGLARNRLVRHRRLATWLLLAAWLTAVVAVVAHHQYWRDEVRAYTLAVSPASWWQLPWALDNEGHPMLWYLLLRFLHALVPGRLVLPVASVSVAFAAMAVYLHKAPYPWWHRALFLVSLLPLYEYSVMARNYGISMLLMMLAAVAVSRRRERPYLLGGALALLANTNAHSCGITLLLALVWAADIAHDYRRRRDRRALIGGLLSWSLVLAGVAASILTVIPDRSSSATAMYVLPKPVVLESLLQAVALPGASLRQCLTPVQWLNEVVVWLLVAGLLERPLLALALYGSAAGLGFLDRVVSLMQLRHQGLFLVLALALYWVLLEAGEPHPPGQGWRWPAVRQSLARLRRLAVFVVLPAVLLYHVVLGVNASVRDWRSQESDTASLGRFLHRHPQYADAILVPEPDAMTEALPYYAPNRIYLPREHRYSEVTQLNLKDDWVMSLDDYLDDAERVKRETGRPVLLPIGFWATPQGTESAGGRYFLGDLHLPPGGKYKFSWYGPLYVLTVTAESLDRLRRETVLLCEFPHATTDESYALYEVKPVATDDGASRPSP